MDKIEITDEFAIALLRGAKLDGGYETLDETVINLISKHIDNENRVNPFDKIRTFNISYSTQATDLLEEEGM